ncbi:hypothetical protein WA158_007937, partial [Blastocystis sp. Blastoise]
MVHRLLECSLGRQEEDDRDHLANKRLDLAGPLVGRLFRTLLYKFTTDLKKYMSKAANDTKGNGTVKILGGLKSKTITSGLQYAFATGNWGDRNSNKQVSAGVSQALNRLTFSSSLSHLRRLKTPMDTSGKQTKPRQLHNTQWGMLCPAETPEGGSCGIVKNLALLSYISTGRTPTRILEILQEHGIEDLEEIQPSHIPRLTKVFVNGVWIGVHRNPNDLLGCRQLLDPDISMIYDIAQKEIR